ncbi:fibulin-1-like isoform X2, partial [Leptotrombidium deliense]
MNGKCVDIDECKEKKYDCPENQVCVNNESGYDCVLAPKVEIGTEISAVDPTSTAFVNEHTSPDTDANGLKRDTKCDEGFTFNVEIGLCIDLRCVEGFQYNNETKLCEDIDECKLPEKVCSSWQRCLNKNGTFACEDIQCEPGFEPNDN